MLLPTGFNLYRGFCSASLQSLQKEISWSQTTIKIFGKEILQPRLTSWMGDASYTYSGRKHEPAKLPEVVDRLRGDLIQLLDTQFNSVLANQYRDGQDSVSWHADNEKELGLEPVIASMSFGASRLFAIRHNETKQRWNVGLEHGDLLVMSGRSQLDYQHSVPKTTLSVGSRINLTFRKIGL